MNELFPDLTTDWFRDNGYTDPEQAFEKWQIWLGGRNFGSTTRLRKVLELATGLTPAAVRIYTNGKAYKYSADTLDKLDAVCRALGYRPPRRPSRIGHPIRGQRGTRRFAIVTVIEGIPSLGYHFEIISSITRTADAHNANVIICGMPANLRPAQINHKLRHASPDGVIFLRLAPGDETLKYLRRAGIPSVIVHGDHINYTKPVLTNITPDYTAVPTMLRAWLTSAIRNTSNRSNEIVVVRMDKENVTHDPQIIRSYPPSIRNERIEMIFETLKALTNGLRVCDYIVPDYSFRHAYEVYVKHSDALAYICLCDEIAVELKHLLLAAGKDVRNRIIGYDDSHLARVEGISSIGQHIEDLGRLAIEKLLEWFTAQTSQQPSWPEFDEIRTSVQLSLRL